jgi:signal transduction histidine kinase
MTAGRLPPVSMQPESLRYNLESSFSNSGTHVGVGLGGMRERVRDLGGQLELQSEGEGATVKVTLPFQELAAQASPIEKQSPGLAATA